MAELVVKQQSTLPADEVIVKAVQFFTNEKWRTQSQSERVVTFAGTPPIPWMLILVTIIGFIFFVIPGVIMYIFLIRKLRRLQNIVVTCNPLENGTEVVISYAKSGKKIVKRFLTSLPKVQSTAVT